jgi:ubiquinone/menaquinone biosynthesis C-methylase UbiE
MAIATAKLSKPEVIKVYSQNAPVYDIWGILTESKARKRSLALARIRDGELILEVAVGTGLTFHEILKANPHGHNTGIDLTPAILEKARRRAAQSGLNNYDLSHGDAYNLQYPDQQFDLLVNNYMFDLLPEEDFITVLTEFKRVLKPGGRLVLINMTKGIHFYQRFWEAVYHLNPKWLGGCRGVLLSPALKAAGFEHIHRETVSQLGFPSEIIIATL